MTAAPIPLTASRNALDKDRAAEINHSRINDLKARVARLERAGGPRPQRPLPGSRRPERVVTLGLDALDTHLPWQGLPRGALHELMGEGVDREQGAVAAGFASLWLAQLQAAGPVLWIVRAAGSKARGAGAIDLHAHGLRQQRLDPRRLILVAARNDDEALWAMEEGLKVKALSAVLGEVEKLDLTASRRLQLAAEAGGVTALVLRRWRLMAAAEREAKQPIAALTRWRIASLPGAGNPRWRVELARCRGGRPGAWILERGSMEGADGSDDLHAAPLSGGLAEVLVGRSLAAGAG